MEREQKIFTRDEIYRKLLAALRDKRPLPPSGWCASKLDEELWRATRRYEPDAFLRQKDTLETSLCYLVDYAVRMPERVNLTESNRRVKEMCEDLAIEIDKITREPDEVITRHGKLKAWLHAILSVQTCLIYREETERFIAEEKEAKRISRAASPKKDAPSVSTTVKEKWQSDLAKSIWQKANNKLPDKPSEQPTLF
jgi:hypothetical protein